MAMIDHEGITDRSLEIIEANDMGGFSVPNAQIFGRSQFLWDSCLVAEAMAYYDPERAAQEIRSLLQGQQPNGMVPNEVSRNSSAAQRRLFGTEVSGDGLVTSGITQPPLIARTVVGIGKHMGVDDRQKFYQEVFPKLVRYHEWLLTDRVVDSTGLIALIHPYESGMDNIPTWRIPMHEYWLNGRGINSRLQYPAMARVTGAYRLLLADLRHVPIEQRSDNEDVLSSFLHTRVLKRHRYDMEELWQRTDIPVQQDVGFNAVFADANEALFEIQEEINQDTYCVPEGLVSKIGKQRDSLHTVLWQADLGGFSGYTNRDPRTGNLISVNTAAGLLPLLTEPNEKRRNFLLERLYDQEQFWTGMPIPSVAIDDEQHNETAYWRGVSWPFVRFIMEKALTKIGDDIGAQELRRITLLRPSEPVKSEYDHPITGEPLGIFGFGPSAAQDAVFSQRYRSAMRHARHRCTSHK